MSSLSIFLLLGATLTFLMSLLKPDVISWQRSIPAYILFLAGLFLGEFGSLLGDPGSLSGAGPTQPVAAEPSREPMVTPPPAALSRADPFREAVNAATKAANLAQTAQTQAEWAIVANEWRRAVDLMKAVPDSSPNYALAQEKVEEYTTYLNYAVTNEARLRP